MLANGVGPAVLARADMDAIPVTEATGLPYASAVNGIMHACGHDLHVSALLGATKLMADGRDAWSGTYMALFQPAEEVGAGFQAIIDDGLITKVPRPDVAVAQHVMPIPAGTVATTNRAAASKGTVARDVPANRSPAFAPVIDPPLSMGVQTHVVAALS